MIFCVWLCLCAGGGGGYVAQGYLSTGLIRLLIVSISPSSTGATVMSLEEKSVSHQNIGNQTHDLKPVTKPGSSPQRANMGLLKKGIAVKDIAIVTHSPPSFGIDPCKKMLHNMRLWVLGRKRYVGIILVWKSLKSSAQEWHRLYFVSK